VPNPDPPGPADHLAALRRSYLRGGLDERDVDPDPVVQLRRWLDDAERAGVVEPNAMVLATVDEHGDPAARTVLLKGLDAGGLTFFTQRRSAKGRELGARPSAAAVFVWHDLDRQVTVRGPVAEVGRAEAEAYFLARPRGHRLAAWASEQSSPVADRAALESAYARAEARFPGEVPVPEHWTGYRLAPRSVELWQGRPDRLHDRLRYRLDGGRWTLERLQP
jgi:pyridoxamine 5'-phosphate oxidase